MSDKAGQAPNEHRTSGEISCNQGNGNNGGSGSKDFFLISLFFSLRNIKKGDQLLLITYFDNFDF